MGVLYCSRRRNKVNNHNATTAAEALPVDSAVEDRPEQGGKGEKRARPERQAWQVKAAKTADQQVC